MAIISSAMMLQVHFDGLACPASRLECIATSKKKKFGYFIGLEEDKRQREATASCLVLVEEERGRGGAHKRE
jgi:hypothetical protein